jgi:hypothetical protein
METLTEEKIHMFKKARLAVQSLERELQEKAKQAHKLKVERLRKQQKVEETPFAPPSFDAHHNCLTARNSDDGARREAVRPPSQHKRHSFVTLKSARRKLGMISALPT